MFLKCKVFVNIYPKQLHCILTSNIIVIYIDNMMIIGRWIKDYELELFRICFKEVLCEPVYHVHTNSACQVLLDRWIYELQWYYHQRNYTQIEHMSAINMSRSFVCVL